MQLEWIVRLGRRDVGLIELDRCARESSIGVPTLALQAVLRAKRGAHLVGIVVCFQVSLNVGCLLCVFCA